MIRFPVIRTILATLLATIAAVPILHSSAAIACQELPVIEPDPGMLIPMIYIELPVTVESAFGRNQPADRNDATGLSDEDAHATIRAAENQFRCLDYGQSDSFAANSTPEGRVIFFARPAVESGKEYVELNSLYVAELYDPIGLDDGRFLIDFGIIVDGTQYLTGELIFREMDGGLYLDGGHVHESYMLNDEPIEVEVSRQSPDDLGVVEATFGDQVRFINHDEEVEARITVDDMEDERIFTGHVMPTGMVGGEDRNVFVVHDLEPGEFTITLTFGTESVKVMTLIVEESTPATPAASPES